MTVVFYRGKAHKVIGRIIPLPIFDKADEYLLLKENKKIIQVNAKYIKKEEDAR